MQSFSHRHCLRQTQSVCARERQRRSNPDRLRGEILDCFAEPVIGPCFARTRWLAMTKIEAGVDRTRKPPRSQSFPPPLWGRARERGKPQAPNSGYPPPRPSPTRGEGVERAQLCAPEGGCLAVIARLDRAIQYAAASPNPTAASGIMDPRFRGDDSSICFSHSDAKELKLRRIP